MSETKNHVDPVDPVDPEELEKDAGEESDEYENIEVSVCFAEFKLLYMLRVVAS